MCGLGSDGAAVMVGVKSGVSALLKEVLKDPRIKVTQAKDVRWLSHDKAINSIRRSFESILTSLEREAQERSDVQAMGLSVFMQKYKFVAAMLMMCDVLPVLSQLSKAMQKKDLDYALMKPLVAATISTIKGFETEPGVHMSTLDDVMNDLQTKPYKSQDKDDEREVYKPFQSNITSNLQARFPDLPLLECLRVFDPSLLPEDNTERSSCGLDSIKTLVNHYKLDAQESEMEWKSIINYIPNVQAHTTSSVMTHVAKQKDAFPNIGKIATAGLLIPTSTADCERGISSLKPIKTILRNNLSTRILGSLMTVSLEGPNTNELNVSECVDMWHREKKENCF